MEFLQENWLIFLLYWAGFQALPGIIFAIAVPVFGFSVSGLFQNTPMNTENIQKRFVEESSTIRERDLKKGCIRGGCVGGCLIGLFAVLEASASLSLILAVVGIAANLIK